MLRLVREPLFTMDDRFPYFWMGISLRLQEDGFCSATYQLVPSPAVIFDNQAKSRDQNRRTRAICKE